MAEEHHNVRLTSLASCAGWASKLGPGDLAQVLRPLANLFNGVQHPELLVGLDSPDDGAVYQVTDEIAIISTVDFFPPVVDDPYDFGAIAAANALSDIYAMGGAPLFAVNLVAFPEGLGMEILTDILRGGAEMALSAGILVVGGHTVTDKEPKYGLAVTGQVDPAKIVRKGGAQQGDKLIITKPLGTGIVTTAHKLGRVSSEDLQSAITSMKQLNRNAAGVAQANDVHAMTDITGFGLIGHAYEMAKASQYTFHISYSELPWLPGVATYAEQGLVPGGTARNEAYFERRVDLSSSLKTGIERDCLYDPQTSGGLLMAVSSESAQRVLEQLHESGDSAALIGWVEGRSDKVVIHD